jgi:hypothetical protein
MPNGCAIVSGELDTSIAQDLHEALKRVEPGRLARRLNEPPYHFISMFRDPISRAVSQFEHHISRHRFGSFAGSDEKNNYLISLVSPSLCHQV